VTNADEVLESVISAEIRRSAESESQRTKRFAMLRLKPQDEKFEEHKQLCRSARSSQTHSESGSRPHLKNGLHVKMGSSVSSLLFRSFRIVVSRNRNSIRLQMRQEKGGLRACSHCIGELDNQG
jgi:hypothetical protein